MRYYGEEALGLVETVETLETVPAIEAADNKMFKAADIELISYENKYRFYSCYNHGKG